MGLQIIERGFGLARVDTPSPFPVQTFQPEQFKRLRSVLLPNHLRPPSPTVRLHVLPVALVSLALPHLWGTNGNPRRFHDHEGHQICQLEHLGYHGGVLCWYRTWRVNRLLTNPASSAGHAMCIICFTTLMTVFPYSPRSSLTPSHVVRSCCTNTSLTFCPLLTSCKIYDPVLMRQLELGA